MLIFSLLTINAFNIGAMRKGIPCVKYAKRYCDQSALHIVTLGIMLMIYILAIVDKLVFIPMVQPFEGGYVCIQPAGADSIPINVG